MSPLSGANTNRDGCSNKGSDYFSSFLGDNEESESGAASARTFILKRRNTKAFPRRKKKKLNTPMEQDM